MTAWEDRMDVLMKKYRTRVQPAKAELTDGEEKSNPAGKTAACRGGEKSIPYLRIR